MSITSLKLVPNVATAGPELEVEPVEQRRAPAPMLSASARIDPFSLRLFVAVMDLGTIAGAAEREHIAPSAVSKRLSDLEHSMKTRLLERSNRGIEPTAAGIELLGLARHVLNELDNVVFRLREYSDGVRGLVRVFASHSAITEFLPACLQPFLDLNPQIQVHLQEEVSSAVLQGVSSNSADVGLYAQSCGDSENLGGMVSLPFKCDELVLIVPAGHPLTGVADPGIDRVLDHDLIGLHTGSHINQTLMREAQKAGRAFRFRMQVTSYDVLSQMVQAGLGAAVVPRIIAQRYQQLDRIRLIRLQESWVHREIRICVRSLEGLTPAARLFVEHLRTHAQG